MIFAVFNVLVTPCINCCFVHLYLMFNFFLWHKILISYINLQDYYNLCIKKNIMCSALMTRSLIALTESLRCRCCYCTLIVVVVVVAAIA